jgi:hypothetical protein
MALKCKFALGLGAILCLSVMATDAQAWFGRGGGSCGSHGGYSNGSGGSFGGFFSRRRSNGSCGSHGGYTNGSCGSHGGYSNGSCGSHGGVAHGHHGEHVEHGVSDTGQVSGGYSETRRDVGGPPEAPRDPNEGRQGAQPGGGNQPQNQDRSASLESEREPATVSSQPAPSGRVVMTTRRGLFRRMF